MRRIVTGEELAQLYNPDPFAMPRWRAPVYRTPLGIILAAKLVKLLAWIIRLVFRHPLAASVLALTAAIWVKLGRVTLVALVLAAIVMLACWRWFWPVSFSRWVGQPARGKWRTWLRREAPCCIPGLAGRNLEDIPGSDGLLKIRKVKGTIACQQTSGRADAYGRSAGKTRVIWPKLNCLNPNLQKG